MPSLFTPGRSLHHLAALSCCLSAAGMEPFCQLVGLCTSHLHSLLSKGQKRSGMGKGKDKRRTVLKNLHTTVSQTGCFLLVSDLGMAHSTCIALPEAQTSIQEQVATALQSGWERSPRKAEFCCRSPGLHLGSDTAGEAGGLLPRARVLRKGPPWKARLVHPPASAQCARKHTAHPQPAGFNSRVCCFVLV